MKTYFLTALTLLLLTSCKTTTELSGEYKSCKNNCTTIVLKPDSTYIETIIPEIGDKYNLSGKWYAANEYLYLQPQMEANVQYDSTRKEYYTYVDEIRVRLDTDYSTKQFKIESDRLYRMYSDGKGHLKSYPCAFMKMPLDKAEQEKVIMQNRKDCQ